MTTTAKKAAIYVRVSTAAKVKAGADSVFEQNPDFKSSPFGSLRGSAVGPCLASIPTGQAAPRRTGRG
jgi:hypothetical protein